ncbi:MAG: BPSS1780 family membrane protein [Gallionella sp.]|nr:BPSS1780 family membrane protein [Gallionella sp.]
MEIQKLNAARGWTWIRQGYQLIMRNPSLSVSLALTGTLAMFIAIRVPVIGPLFAVFLMPTLMAGYMRVCRALEEDEEVELAQMFAGFKKHLPGLFTLGAQVLLGLLIASMVVVFIGGDALGKLLQNFQSASDPEVMANAMWAAGSGVSLSLILGFALVCLLMMAAQYAPMLVFFSHVTPLAALRLSLVGTLRNIIPYTVYSLIIQMIGLVLSMLPYGIGLIALLPLGLTSLYVSYRNIFPFEDEIAAPPAPGAAA